MGFFQVTTKHHRGKRGSAQWLPDLSEDDEFAVFDWADEWEVADKVGNLFGAFEDGEEGLRFLGILQEQIAKFPRRPQGQSWHGYPVWAINAEGPGKKRRQEHCPPQEVFDRMVEVGLITKPMSVRLKGAKHL